MKRPDRTTLLFGSAALLSVAALLVTTRWPRRRAPWARSPGDGAT